MPVLPVVLAAAMYARFFGGFWLGDDFPNLHHSWLAAQRGELLTQAWAELIGAGPWRGAFYRPLMIESLLFNQWLAGDRYAGWYALNHFAHLANAGLVWALVSRLAAVCGCEGRIVGALAAAFFAVSPVLAEGVFWVSARADAFVTLFTLGGLFLWASPRTDARVWLGPSLLLMLALGFKESAAVFPLQMLTVALLWPRRLTRGQLVAIAASFVLVVAFLAFRAHLFGSAWEVYPSGADGPFTKLQKGIASLPSWWRALFYTAPAMSFAYLAAGIATALLAAASAKGNARKLAAALLISFGGLGTATMLNLGALPSTGEGGRLTYGPVIWLALALGVALSRPPQTTIGATWIPGLRLAGLLLFATTTAVGLWVLEGVLREARAAQNDVREMSLAGRAWTDSHPGLTLLVIPEMHGPVVTTRNGQGVLILPPVQAEALWHRMLPTLPRDVPAQHGALAAGYGKRLERIRPSTADPEIRQRLLEPDAPHWPEYYACWDATTGKIVQLAAPDPGDPAQWADTLRRGIAGCGL
jgi:hypothetical protein